FDILTEPIQATWSPEEVRKEEMTAAKAKVEWNSQWRTKMVAWLKNHQQEMEAENRRIDERIRLSAQPQDHPPLQPRVVIPSIEDPEPSRQTRFTSPIPTSLSTTSPPGTPNTETTTW